MTQTAWWREAVVYQVFLRSFADADGDGIGDLAGLTAHLDHIASLGVDAIWLSPCFRSPQRDSGYDVADFLDIDPAYGTLDDLDDLVRSAHRRDLRVLLDIVPNHASTDHAWFRSATADGDPDARARFHFRPGRGDGQPPNNWQSVFGGPAWTAAGDGSEEWYLHSFDASQPDLDWSSPDVAAHFDEVLSFWFDRGIDGFRIDVAHGLVKADGLPDWPGADDGSGGHNFAQWDQPGVHDVYRRWRRLADLHELGPRYLVGEVWVPDRESLHGYLRPDELHQAFEFDLLVQPWSAPHFRDTIVRVLADPSPEGPVWTLSNHDVHRTVTRYGQEQDLRRPDPTDMLAAARRGGSVDLELGTARARAALLLMLALPGTVYLYQGEELGLPEVLDLPDAARIDPVWLRSGGAQRGRDGCRVPLPWTAASPGLGFSACSAGALPWLPQPDEFAALAVETQDGDTESTLHLYRRAIADRRSTFGGATTIEWLDAPEGVLAFRRGTGVCVVNFVDATARWIAADGVPVLESAPTLHTTAV